MKKIIAIIALLAVSLAAEIAITIYSDGFTLVKEKKQIEFNKGFNDYDYSPIPSGITPVTVHFEAQGVSVLEQNYEYDLASTERLLQKSIDKQIRILTSETEVYEGTLLSVSSNSILLDSGNKMVSVSMDKILDITFMDKPDRFYTRPTLAWMLYSQSGGKKETELSYMTNGLGWEAAYVATVNKDDDELNLDGWVDITNNSGMTYEEATLKLVAGDVNRVTQEPRYARSKNTLAMDAVPEAAAGFQEEEFFEYHLYTLPRAATVADRQKKQLSLFEPATTPAKKCLVFEPRKGTDVRVEMEFTNSEEKGLGMPLPAGVIRVYKEDKSGALQFVGEDRIDHTPKDEELRIYLGNAFDVVAERTRTDYRRISNRTSEEDYKIEIRNHKDEKITVKVIEHFWGDWYIKKQSIQGEKEDSRTNVWRIPVPADGSSELTFTVYHK